MSRATAALHPSHAPPDDFAEDVLVEMANLGETDTHIPGTIFISTALGFHGPRIKWYPGAAGRALPCLIMSIAPEPVVRDDFLLRHVSRPVVPQLAEWVMLNHAALMTFWDEGDSWDRHRVAQFIDALRPIGR